MNAKLKYEKYKNTETNEYLYELTFPNGNKHMVDIQVGDYIHQLEQKSNNKPQSDFELKETLRNEYETKKQYQRRNNY